MRTKPRAFATRSTQLDQAIALARHAIESDPLDVWPRMNLQAYLHAAGREREALDVLKAVLELDPHQVVALVATALILADKGDLAQALAVARRPHSIAPWYPDTAAVLAALLRCLGEDAESLSLVASLGIGPQTATPMCGPFSTSSAVKLKSGLIGRKKAIEQRDHSIQLYLRFVVSKGLRASDRWPRIAKMLNLPADGSIASSAAAAQE